MDDNDKILQLKQNFKKYLKENVNQESIISQIHPELDFYYNSLNMCVGKAGTGKTTLLLKQLMILNNVAHNYGLIIYLSNIKDDFFLQTVKLFNKIPIVHKSFEEGTECLDEYLNNEERNFHIFVIIEDATGLLESRNNMWEQWVIKLRHLKMTIWINLHEWIGISNKLREQVSCVFLCKGIAKTKCGVIFRQLNLPYEAKIIYGIYCQLRDFQYFKIDNIKNKTKIID